MLRLAYITSHPIQYQVPVFRVLAARDDVSLKVFFCETIGLKKSFDPGFGKEIQWDVPLLDGYNHAFIRNHSRRPGTKTFLGLFNPGIVKSLALFKPHVVVVNGYAHASSHFALWASRALGIPALITGDSNLLRHRPSHVLALKRFAAIYLRGLVAGAIAIGTNSRDYFIHYGMAPNRVFLAPYVVDNSFFSGRRDEAEVLAGRWRKALGVEPSTVVCGFAAKFVDAKACCDLIDAFAAARVPESALILVGEGPLRPSLEAQAALYPDAQIIFAGFANQTEMPAAYAMFDLFVLPSKYENWGLAVNEAMNMGRAVVVSDQVGCANDLARPENAWVFKARDVKALTILLKDALSDSERLHRMGQRSAEIIEGYGLARAADGILSAALAVRR